MRFPAFTGDEAAQSTPSGEAGGEGSTRGTDQFVAQFVVALEDLPQPVMRPVADALAVGQGRLADLDDRRLAGILAVLRPAGADVVDDLQRDVVIAAVEARQAQGERGLVGVAHAAAFRLG